MNNLLFRVFLLIAISFVPAFVIGQTKPRARDLGVPFEGTPGQFNAITDVKGVEVGYATLISGEGKTAVRTGVTAILPQGKDFKGRVFA
ncbi:MAG TPA: P1 family peptidase, partial [Pyrinomonadaceae bacterium]|nr:P1 family peptidase [Pyrinomonadaceae bacterium]